MPKIDTDKLEQYASVIYDRLEEFNDYTLKTIARRIKATGELSAYDQQALKNIADITGDMDAITKKLAEITKMNISDIESIYTKVMTDGVNTYKPLYDFKNIPFVPFEENEYAKQLVRNWAVQTAGEMINLSRTKALGFDKYDALGNVIGHTPLKGAYEQAISSAVVAVSSGTTDFNSAMKKTIENLGGSGVKVTYGSGVNRSLSAMVRQNILYGAKQSAQSYDEYIGQKLGCNGFEVDAHAGCRPSHLFMQGKMFSYTGKVTVNGITYEDGNDALKALGDYGCLHFKSDVILGVSPPAYSKDEIERINRESTELIEYDGKKKTLYEWKQTQRRLERSVRNKQTKADMFRESGNKTRAKEIEKEISVFRDKYDDMCKNIKGLESRTERMKTYKSGLLVDKQKMIRQKELIRQKERDVFKNAVIQETKQKTKGTDVHYIGKIDKGLLEQEFGKIKTSEVVLTDERRLHIKEHHPNDFDMFEQNCKEVVAHPQTILKDEKNADTIFMINHIDETNLNVVVKLAVVDDEKHPKNSIMTSYRIRDKNVKKFEKKNKVLYKSE